MKKVIFGLTLSLLVLTLSTKTSFAQGTFGCQYSEASNLCVSRKDDNCEAGYLARPTLCGSLRDPESCNTASFQCSSGSILYRCASGQCAPCDSGENCQYTSESNCLANCRLSPSSEVYCNQDEGETAVAINTAIGCIPFGDSSRFIGFFLRWGIGIGGGIAFLLILYAGFMIMTSTGNPDRLKAGRELLTSAITGLLLLIFSVFVLRVIGVEILQIPGFGG